jgi:hypothetical protein
MDTTQLEKRWYARITSCAAGAAMSYRDADYDPGYDGRHDHVVECVEKMLFDSIEWEAVEATIISDIAYEAATTALARVIRS